MDPFYLAAYWGSRRESSLRCGERLAFCLSRLGEIDGALESWFRRGASKAAAKTPVALDPESLGRLLVQGVNRRDVDGEVLDELGFSLGLWNRARPAIGLSGTVGAHPSFPGVLNSLVLDFPPPEAEGLRLYEPGVAEAIFDAVIEAWEPDWATWTSNALRNMQSAAPREPAVGWMTYLTAPVGGPLRGVTSRPLLNGTVITTGKTVSSAEEAVVLDVRTQLARVGALQAIP
jgi:hypothetical protein